MLRRAVGRWYGLSFRPADTSQSAAICITIYEPCVTRLSMLAQRFRHKDEMVRAFRASSYECDLTKGFGFDGSIVAVGLEGNYRVLEAPLTTAARHLNLAGSISELFALLQWPGFDLQAGEEPWQLDGTREQQVLLTSDINPNGGLHSSPLYGYTSSALIDWVEGKYQEGWYEVTLAEEAMLETWNTLTTQPKRVARPSIGCGLADDFLVRVGENGRFLLRTIGNSCEVETEDWSTRRKGEGLRLGCHNLDSPIQQLSLLAGLARLHELAEQD